MEPVTSCFEAQILLLHKCLKSTISSFKHLGTYQLVANLMSEWPHLWLAFLCDVTSVKMFVILITLSWVSADFPMK